MLRRARIHSTRGFPALQERADEGHTWTHRPIERTRSRNEGGRRTPGTKTRTPAPLCGKNMECSLRRKIIVALDNRLSRRARRPQTHDSTRTPDLASPRERPVAEVPGWPLRVTRSPPGSVPRRGRKSTRALPPPPSPSRTVIVVGVVGGASPARMPPLDRGPRPARAPRRRLGFRAFGAHVMSTTRAVTTAASPPHRRRSRRLLATCPLPHLRRHLHRHQPPTAAFFASSTVGAALHAQQADEIRPRRQLAQRHPCSSQAEATSCTPLYGVLLHLVGTLLRRDREQHERHVAAGARTAESTAERRVLP